MLGVSMESWWITSNYIPVLRWAFLLMELGIPNCSRIFKARGGVVVNIDEGWSWCHYRFQANGKDRPVVVQMDGCAFRSLRDSSGHFVIGSCFVGMWTDGVGTRLINMQFPISQFSKVVVVPTHAWAKNYCGVRVWTHWTARIWWTAGRA